MNPDKQIILSTYPHAVAERDDRPRAHFPWVIRPWPGASFILGGGATEWNVWYFAAIGIRRGDRLL